MSRILLGSTSTTSSHDSCTANATNHAYDALSAEVSHSDHDEAFTHVYYVMLFVASLWFVGKLFQKIGMPALVGEIIMGIVMGPNLLNLVGDHGSEFLIIIGEIGLIMLVVEAGIDVDIGMLKLIGPRGLGIAILGSIIPLLMGFGISMALANDIRTSIAIGSCFAPTSMGIALNVLKKAKILNTPTGQLIIAAAILDDVIALIILSELGAMNDPSPKNIILPLVISPVLILIIGYLSIRWIPKWIKKIMTKIPKEHHENSILALLFAATFALIPACHYVGSSHLLGAFLAGLMFCTDHTIHHVWSHQIKRILMWMLRIFFSCTIGFAIPIKEFTSPTVIMNGLIYFICFIGKIVTGFFGRPLNKKEFFTIGFSMSAWGEFAFIIATASYEEGTIDKESFSAVLLAVLLSVIISPYCLRLTLSHYEKVAQKRMNDNMQKYGDTNIHPVYFAINTKARGKWGHQDKILHKIFSLDLEIIDFRAWHAPEFNHSHHLPLTKESFYVMDQETLLPPTKHLNDADKQKLKERVKQIRKELKEVLGDKSVVNIKRWLPGVLKNEDTFDKKDALFGEHVPKTLRRPSYCRREAFKQAHSIMTSIDLDFQKELERVATDRARYSKEKIESYGGEPSDSPKLGPVPEPDALTVTKSVPTLPPSIATKLPAKVHFQQIQLVRHLSENDSFHTGSGHGGKTKGAGALPFTNKMINIHDHLEVQPPLPRHKSPVDQDSDDSTSYIYGDEDAQHHKLPEYSPSHAQIESKLRFQQFTNSKQPLTIKEEDGVDEDEDDDMDEIEIVTTKVSNATDIKEKQEEMSMAESVESSVHDALPIEHGDDNLHLGDVQGNFPGSKMSLKTHSAASDHDHEEPEHIKDYED